MSAAKDLLLPYSPTEPTQILRYAQNDSLVPTEPIHPRCTASPSSSNQALVDSGIPMRNRLLLPLASLLLTAACLPAHAVDCVTLTTLPLPGVTIETAETISGGFFAPPYGDPAGKLPPFCRVAGVIHPAADSHIRFEVWMPETGWNRKVIGTGNGGFAGTIYYSQMAGNLRRGYASFGSDGGHQAEAEDASWAYQHPEKIIDYGYRALHLTTENAKKILSAFYGTAPHESYFDSCSDGGREALMEAQRYPEDYDGILAGAPANDWSHMLASGIDVSKSLVADPAAYISSMKLPAITAAVLAACDAQDGLKDGILNDPRQCHFDPATLLCKQGDALTCLTAPQVASLRKLYAGGTDSQGRSIFPGLMPGDEAGAWKSWVTGSAPGGSNYVQNYFRYMVYNDPTWNLLTANVDQGIQAADSKTAQQLNATDPDLSRFAEHGGKLILYHGWNDPAISPLNTIRYVNQVAAKMGAEKAQSFVRLYMVAGMEHCAGGPGPSAFGQLGIPSAKGEPFGAFTALEAWVESNKAPGEIIATKYDETQKPVMTRPICPYPQAPKYNGSGDAKDAGSFRCQ